MEYKGFEVDTFIDDRPRKGKGPFAARPTPYCCRWRKPGEIEWQGTLFGYKNDAAATSGAMIAIDEWIAK